ncbi:MAG: ATP-binding protein [Vicinamibacterales bacterium]
MPHDRLRSPVARYGIAVATPGIAATLRLLVAPDLGLPALLLILLSLVLFTATVAGTGPGVLALVLGAGAAAYWLFGTLAYVPTTAITHAVTLAVFVTAGATFVLLNRGRRQAEADRRVAQATAHALRAQAQTEAMFRAVLESAPYAVLTVDERGKIVLANSQAELLFGYPRQDLLGASIEQLLPEDLRAVHSAHRQDYHANPRVRPMGPGLDLRARRRDGNTFPAEISLSPLETDHGTLVTAIVRDVSEERRAQDERARLIREQAARIEAEATERRSAFLADISTVVSSSLDYHTTLSNVARLVVPDLADWCSIEMATDDGRIEQLAVAHVDPDKVRWAREVRQRFPLDPDDSGGVPQVIRTGQPQLYATVPDALIDERVTDPGLRRALHDAGIVSVMIVPLVGRRRVLGAISFTSTRESTRHFDRSDLAFAQEVARRAAIGVENAQLYGEAQEANRVKDDFLATLSHELRTPLNAVLGWTRLLQGGALDPETSSRALQAISRNAEAQGQLINDLLDVSRIVSGKIILECSDVNVNELIDDALESVKVAAGARGVSTEAEFAHGAVVWADRDRLRQVLWNLVTNAVKFTPAGGRITVSVKRRDHAVDLSVRDTGVGIDPALLPYVFDRFRQGESGITRHHGGLGLGLAIVRHLVEMHGGTVTAASDGQGKGAVFTVHLPAGSASRATGEVLESERQRGAQPLAGIHIVAVDDDPDARNLLRATLSGAGASVTIAASAPDALGAIRESPPDVLVTDLAMPSEDGYWLLRQLEKFLPDHKVPAIALSAGGKSEERSRALAAGFDDFLPKPMEPDQLVRTVRSAAGPHASSHRSLASSKRRKAREVR